MGHFDESTTTSDPATPSSSSTSAPPLSSSAPTGAPSTSPFPLPTSTATPTPSSSSNNQKKLEDNFDAFPASKAADLAKLLREAQIPYKIHIAKDHDMKERLCLEVKRLRLSAQTQVGVAVEVGRGNGEVDGAPVGAKEDRGGADVEEDDGVAGSDVVVDSSE